MTFGDNLNASPKGKPANRLTTTPPPPPRCYCRTTTACPSTTANKKASKHTCAVTVTVVEGITAGTNWHISYQQGCRFLFRLLSKMESIVKIRRL